MHALLSSGRLALLILGASTLAQAAGTRFEHRDWVVACDNTGTCRAAGYAAEGAAGRVASLLLVRQAGPHQPVQATLQIADSDDGSGMPCEPVAMRAGGRLVGTVDIDLMTRKARLSPKQTAAALDALRASGQLEWFLGADRWSVSGAGAAAVMLKMDALQGRIGTPGALMRPGQRPDADVNKAAAPPLVAAMPVRARQIPEAINADTRSRLLAALAATPGAASCPVLAASPAGKAVGTRGLTVWRLPPAHIVVAVECNLAAYNVAVGFWVANSLPPYAPTLITSEGTDYDAGEVTASFKGQGGGFCWSKRIWTWTGKDFVATRVADSGLCRPVVLGGAWDLPTLVTSVRARPQPL